MQRSNYCSAPHLEVARSTLGHAIRGLLFSIVLWWSISLVPAQQATNETNQWETLHGCQLATNEFLDGDNFHVFHEGRKYIFRLYFVDAPESDASLSDRIKDQAAYFGIAENDVPRAGKMATGFVRDKLSGTNFTVTTRWQNAMGRSSLARFYCGITIGNENLAEQLVANGLARISGVRANFPNERSATMISRLKNLELSAREKQLGVWKTNHFTRVSEIKAGGETNELTEATGQAEEPASPLVNPNTATQEELMALPGIGKVMAERIMTNRPFESVDDLLRVPGIGAKTLEKLRPLIRVAAQGESPASAAE